MPSMNTRPVNQSCGALVVWGLLRMISMRSLSDLRWSRARHQHTDTAGLAHRRAEAKNKHPHVLDQLRRVLDHEDDTQHRDAHRQPAEMVVAGRQPTASGIDRLDRSP